jgi:NADPH-dependent ferric siderophore reductase
MELIRWPVKARVTETRVLTRQLVRVTVTAEELDRFEYVGPDQLVRIFLPPRLGAPLVLPKTEKGVRVGGR